MGIKKYIRFKALIILFILIFFPLVSSAVINVPNPDGLFTSTDMNTIIGRLANFVIGAIGILGIMFLVWGAILYVTSAGNEDQIEKAKDTLRYAVIGLFVAGFAYGIEVILFSLFSAGI